MPVTTKKKTDQGKDNVPWRVAFTGEVKPNRVKELDKTSEVYADVQNRAAAYTRETGEFAQAVRA